MTDRDVPLMRDRSFWGMLTTQFLGAFNDNFYKQLILLLAIPKGKMSFQGLDRQGQALVVFAAAFVLFSGLAGFLSDRFSKSTIIVLSKFAEIVVMVLGGIAFLMFATTGESGLLLVLFLMGMQSAFFGPGKYGILPEMLAKQDLPRANGLMVMTTFLAIILGIATAGAITTLLVSDTMPLNETAASLWRGSAICVVIAVIGTGTALLIRHTPPAQKSLRFEMSSLFISRETRKHLAADRPLIMALVVSCLFWLVCGVAHPAVNRLGLSQLQVDEFWTSLLTAAIGVGIAIGAVIAGKLCRGRVDFRVVKFGSWGIVVCLLALSITLPSGRHLLGYYGSLVMLIALGICAGCFAIPIQVFIQDRPVKSQKGRVIAVMNQSNFLAILLAGAIYGGLDGLVEHQQWPRSVIFCIAAIFVLPVALAYRPQIDATSEP